MAVREALQSLRDEFAARAAQSALARYSRDASHLTDEQLNVRYQQLMCNIRQLKRDTAQTYGEGISRVPTQWQLAIQDLEAMKEAFEQERFVRNARTQMAAAFA